MVNELLYKLSNGFTILPIYLGVNITNVCNRSCNFCPYHSKHILPSEHDKWFKQQPKMLNFKSFMEIIKRPIARRMIKTVALTGKGEPFLNKDLFKYCELLEQYKIPFTITTNGDYLTGEILKYLSLFSCLKEISISIYETDNPWLKVYHDKIGFSNMTGKELPFMEKIETAPVNGTENYCSLPKDFNTIKSCKKPFTWITINTDGTIVPCWSFNTTANIKDSWLKIWNGKKIRKYRRDALKMKAKQSDCKNCAAHE